jgi:hypothetical protein
LRALGYEGGYDAVRRYARRWGEQHASATAEAFVPLTFSPGEAYQFDSHGGRRVKSFCWSRVRVQARASAGRGSRMRSTGEAGMREAYVLDARLVVSPKMFASSERLSHSVGFDQARTRAASRSMV